MKRAPRHFLLTCLILGIWAIAGCSLFSPSASPVATSTASDQKPTSVPASETPGPGSPSKSTQTTQSPETAAAFEPLSASASDCEYGGEFKSIQALDEKTVRFELCKPDVAFLAKIAFPSFGIVPAKRLEQTGGGGKGNPLLLEPIGTGPYRFDYWRAGEELGFAAFEGYWGSQNPRTPNLVFRWDLDDSQRLVELQSGTVQGIDNPNPQDFQSIQDDPGLIRITRPPISVAFLGMNNTYPPMDTQLVRQAISLSIDRQALIDEYFAPGFELAEFFTPCVIPNGCVGEPWYGYDPPKARELLAQAGFPNGFQTQISYRNVVRGYMPQPAALAGAIRSQLQKNLNISARLVPIDSPEFLSAADEGLLPGLFLLGWGADYPDVSNFLDTHFGVLATMMFGNPFDDILEPLIQGAAVADESARRSFYETANDIIRQHVPMIPLAHGGWVTPQSLAVAFSRSVQGASASPFSFERFGGMQVQGGDTLVWMQSQEPLSLYCADETDSDSLRACAQVIETLYQLQNGSAQLEPALAEKCEPDQDLKAWTCHLRPGVKFHDGSLLNANDVVMSFLVQWDAASPLHKGHTGEFLYFQNFFGAFLNSDEP